MLSSCFGGLTKPTLSTFSCSTPKPPQPSSPAPPRPITSIPLPQTSSSRLRPAPHPPSWHLMLLPGSSADPRVRPTATVRDLEYPDAADCSYGEFELTVGTTAAGGGSAASAPGQRRGGPACTAGGPASASPTSNWLLAPYGHFYWLRWHRKAGWRVERHQPLVGRCDPRGQLLRGVQRPEQTDRMPTLLLEARRLRKGSVKLAAGQNPWKCSDFFLNIWGFVIKKS